MDGSTIVIPSAAAPSGLAREDALFRIVYYGEALRAITEHVNDTLISGPCGPMIEMLDDAFDTMSETRDTFGPEEFTLFVMSRCWAAATRRTRRGNSRSAPQATS
jgi:hypothetical protein